MRLWVVGAGGLLGGGVVRAARRRGWSTTTSRVPWSRPDSTIEVLAHDLEAFLADVAEDETWSVAWCAGVGVVGSSTADLDAESRVFEAFCRRLGSLVDAGRRRRGAVFVASSAGGVHAGSDDPPFDERTPPRPLSPYGEQKLRIERAVDGLVRESGVPALVGRISNLYGPGQDLSKPQGIVSQLGRAFLTRQPLPVYVSLDTMRDYLYVDDCAAMVVRALEELAAQEAPSTAPVTKILASGRSTTIAAVLGEYRRVFKRPPPVVLAQHPSSRFQVRDLRMRSVVWPDLDAAARTPLGAGIAATARDISMRLHDRPGSTVGR